MDFPIQPTITIEADPRQAFPVRFEQVLAEFLRPEVGETSHVAEYSVNPDGTLKYIRETRSIVRGKAKVHGLDCVEVAGNYTGFRDGKIYENSTFVRVWEGHIQTLAAVEDCYGVKYIQSYLDAPFQEHYATGENNCGLEIELRPKGIIRAEGNRLFSERTARGTTDIVGRYRVCIEGREFDTLRLVLFGAEDQISDFFIASDGREVLHRFYAPKSFWEMENANGLEAKIWPPEQTAECNGEPYRINEYFIPDYVL